MSSRDDTLELSSIDRGFIGSPPLLCLMLYERMIDPELLYRSVLTTLAAMPLFSSQLEAGDDGGYRLRHVERCFNFLVGDGQLPGDLREAHGISFRELHGLLDDPPTAVGQPVMGVRLTRLPRGCALCFRFSHCVADAESLKLFFFALLQALQGRELPRFSLQRSFPFERRRAGPPASGDGYPSYRDHPHQQPHPPRTGQVRFLQLSASFVEEQLGQLHGRGLACTSHDVIAAWLIKHHGLSLLAPRKRLNIRIPINVRPLCKHVEPTYLGNAFVDSFLSWSEEELQSLETGELAITIRGALERLKSPEYLDARIFVDEHGINYDRFGAEDHQGFDPQGDIIITSIGEVAHFLELGAGPATRFVLVPAVPLAFVVQKHGGDYLISMFSPRE